MDNIKLLAENFIMFRYNLMDIEKGQMIHHDWKKTHEHIKPYLRDRYVNKWFVPQTLGDQIWYFYQFSDKKSRNIVFNSLPVEFIKYTEQPDQQTIDHWCK